MYNFLLLTYYKRRENESIANVIYLLPWVILILHLCKCIIWKWMIDRLIKLIFFWDLFSFFEILFTFTNRLKLVLKLLFFTLPCFRFIAVPQTFHHLPPCYLLISNPVGGSNPSKPYHSYRVLSLGQFLPLLTPPPLNLNSTSKIHFKIHL